MNLLQSHSLDLQSHKSWYSCKCHTRDIENMWSVLNPPFVYVCPFVCAGHRNIAERVKNILMKGRRPVYYKENKKIQETERLLGPLLSMESGKTCFRGQNHRAVGASMWLLSQWGNTDQVVQWAKAGVVKSSSEKNSSSLGGTKYPCVGYGHKLSSLFRSKLLCEAYANVKDDSESPS